MATSKPQREPQTINEAKSFLEGMLRRDESFNLSMTLDVHLYGSRVTRGESFDLYWYTADKGCDALGRQHVFRSHSIVMLLREFIAWRALHDKPRPLPPAKANIGARPIRRLEHKEPVSLWGDDPE